MMDAPESQIRTGLRLLAESPAAEVEVDFPAVVADGEKLRRSRRARWAAAVGVVAVVGLGSLTAPLFNRAVPAVPSPAAPATPSRTLPATASSSAHLDFDVFDASDLTFDSVEVTTDLAGDIVTVEVVAQPFKGEQVVKGFQTRAGTFGWAQVAPGLIVALVPEPVRTVVALGGQESHVDTGELAELGAVTVGIQTPDRPFAGLIWEGTDGVLRNSAGDVVPSADLTYQVEELPAPGLTSRSMVVFRDETLSVWGYIDRNGDTRATHPLDEEPVGSVAAISATSDGGYFYALTAIGFLPLGGSDPDLGLAVPAARWTAAELGNSGRIAFVAVADKIEAGQVLVERVAYTDKSGSRVSYEPR